MFDIGFSELFVIALVALIVIGPERLPKVARAAGHLFGRLQRYVNDVKADINREMELEDLKKIRDQFQDAARSVQQQVNQVGQQATQQVHEVQSDLNHSIAGDQPAVQPPAAPPAETPQAEASPPGPKE
jgi:sec-independent protein translocase protein TatB